MGKKKSVKQPLLEDEDDQGQPQEQVKNSDATTGSLAEWNSIPSPTAAFDISHHSNIEPQYNFRVSGPGVKSATANYPTHVLVELIDTATGQPCTRSQAITAELHSLLTTEEKHHNLFKRKHRTRISVDQLTTSTYRISFTVATRGEHQLHVLIDGVEIGGSPCNITLYPNPNQFRKPIGEIPNRTNAWGAAVNSRGEIIVSDFSRNEVVVLDGQGEVIASYDCRGPTGIAVDSDDNVYVSCADHVRKFSHDGLLKNSVGKSGQNEGEFIRPEGLAIHNGLLYVCDTFNNRIQVFDMEQLDFVKIIGCQGSGNIEFNHPWAIDIDPTGRAYVADQNNNRVQVINVQSGGFLKEIGRGGGKGGLSRPTGVRILGEFLYVSDDDNCRVAVYRALTGEFVTSFGGHCGHDKGKKYRGPFRICCDIHEQRFLYVFDLTSAHIF